MISKIDKKALSELMNIFTQKIMCDQAILWIAQESEYIYTETNV